MGIVIRLNKRQQTPLIDNNLIIKVIYTTPFTVEYDKEEYDRLRKESEVASSGIIRKRCRILMDKMSEPKLSSGQIAAIAGCSHNFINEFVTSVCA